MSYRRAAAVAQALQQLKRRHLHATPVDQNQTWLKSVQSPSSEVQNDQAKFRMLYLARVFLYTPTLCNARRLNGVHAVRPHLVEAVLPGDLHRVVAQRLHARRAHVLRHILIAQRALPRPLIDA